MDEELREMSLKLSDVPRRFNVSNQSTLCARDVIAYVRGDIEDPWIPVVLDTKDKPIAIQELEECMIYWKGVNDDKALELYSLSSSPYCVIDVSKLDIEKEDCGLLDLEMDFGQKYNLRNFTILITGSDTEKDREVLTKLRQYTISTEKHNIIYPRFVIISGKLLPNGIDISPFAVKLADKRQRNELSYTTMDAVLEEIKSKVTPGVSIIQDLEENRTKDVSMLTTYLTLKYNLPPMHSFSFIVEYLEYRFFHPFEKLSLYERISFLYTMPPVIGYLSVNYSFNCLGRVVNKIYPLPHYVLNLNTMTLEEDVSKFALDTKGIRFSDFRRSFGQSLQPFVRPAKKGLIVAGNTDSEADRALVQLFNQLMDLVTEEAIYPSVKNCVYAMLNNTRYLLYCPEECGIEVEFMSEYFGRLRQVVPERDFFRLIDSQFEMALLKKSRASNVMEGNKSLALRWREFDPKLALKPALPFETTLYMNLLPPNHNGLSYYDKYLRCYTDILPIITSTDSDLRDVNPMFDTVSLENIKKDPQASRAINCFGTLSSPYGNHILPMTYHSFENRGLL